MNRDVSGLCWKRWLFLGACWLLGGVFIYAGLLKTNDSQAFADNIAAYQLLPELLINPIALSLPVFEILSGLLLIAGWQRRLGTLAILVLTIVFALFITSALARGLRIDCGCFGSSTIPLHLQLWFALARDLLLLIMAGLLYRNKWMATAFPSSPKTKIP